MDRLLASLYISASRWGAHWLDKAIRRIGHSGVASAQRHRGGIADYVIESFNNDRPFDRFMREQIAGDLMPASSLKERRRQLVATALLAMGNYNLEDQDKQQLEMDVVDEQIDTLSKAFLAQTIACARCHDHKFDPIPTRDYYALAGILHSTQTVDHANVSHWLEIPLPVEPALEKSIDTQEAAMTALRSKIADAKALLAKAQAAKLGSAPVAVADLPGIVIDDRKAKQVGTWLESKKIKPYIGDGYLTDDGDRTAEKTLTFTPEIPESGKYEVRFAYTPAANRASTVSVTVFSPDGDKTVLVNEKQLSDIDGHFVSLGTYSFEKNGQGFVTVSNQHADGRVIADAVQFLPADAAIATAPSHASGAAKTQRRPRRSAKWRRSSRISSSTAPNAMQLLPSASPSRSAIPESISAEMFTLLANLLRVVFCR